MDPSPLLLTPAQAAKCLNVTRSFLYAHLLATHALPSVKLGKCRRIPWWALDEYIARIAIEQGIEVPPALASRSTSVNKPSRGSKVHGASLSQAGVR
jgi:excisionase family DNA binding protein